MADPPPTPQPVERPPKGRGRAIAQGLALLTLSLAVSFAGVELAWRLLLGSETALGQRLRTASLYADPFSDDLYWLLRHHWLGDDAYLQPPKNPHPRLGWHSYLIRPDLTHIRADQIGDRRPVLLYGDSFAQTMPGEVPFERVFNTDPEFNRDHFLLNYGVGGYGVDQIYLSFEGSIDHYDDPFVLFSLMTHDLDRSVLSVRIGQKPYFGLDADGELELRGVPVDSDPQRFFDANRPRVRSYVLRRLARLRPDPRALRATIQRKRAINGAILDAAIRELEARELDYVIFVFHSRQAFIKGPGWRSRWLKSTLEGHGVPYMWSLDIIADEAAGIPIDDLFDPKHVHPTTQANRIFARAMIERIVAAAPIDGAAPATGESP